MGIWPSSDRMSALTPLFLESCNPSTGESLGEVPVDSTADIVRKITLARQAGRGWRSLTPRQRADYLRGAASRLYEAEEELSNAVTIEMGKPIMEARREVRKCFSDLESTLFEIEEALSTQIIESETTRSLIVHEGRGVAAAIAPWNYPVLMPHRLLLPALMAGNSVLFKPSEHTPLIGNLYASILGYDLPESVLQIVHGGSAQGAFLVDQVDLVAFVGSRAVGKQIITAASQTMPRLILELGGSDPMLVLDDANVERAVEFATYNAFRNSGQACTCTRRVYVARALYKKFEDALVSRVSSLRVGDGRDPQVDVGPLAAFAFKTRFLAGITHAKERGAVVLCGGSREGNFVDPIVMRDPLDRDVAGAYELFGPAVFVSSFEDEDEAVCLANRTRYGLGATVFTGDESRGLVLASRIEGGMVGVNGSCVGVRGSPWVGTKESGYGYHGSADGHRQFAQTKVVSIHRQEL